MITEIKNRVIHAELPVINVSFSPAESRHIKAELEKVITLLKGRYQDVKALRGEMDDVDYRELMAERMHNFISRICAHSELDEDIDEGIFGGIDPKVSDEPAPSAHDVG